MNARTRLIGLVALLVAGIASAKGPARAAPWNGGKQAPPARIDASLEEGSSPVVVVRVTPGVDCRNLVTEVRGVDGVTLDAPAVLQHPTCVKDGTVEQRVVVHPPAEGTGFAAFTVRFEHDGRPWSVTRALTMSAPGNGSAKVRAKKLPSREARIETQPNGERTVILRSKN